MMADGRSKSEWSHTSNILAMFANVNRDPKKRKRPYESKEFNPHFMKSRSAVKKVKLVDIKDFLLGLGDFPRHLLE